MPEYVTTKVFLHSNKETMWELADKLGLKGKAHELFRYALYEVGVELLVNKSTGAYVISKVDGRELVSTPRAGGELN